MPFPVGPVEFDFLYYQDIAQHEAMRSWEPVSNIIKIRQAHLAFLYGDDAKAAELLETSQGALKVGLESLLSYEADRRCVLPEVVEPANDVFDVEGAMYCLYAKSMQHSELAQRSEALHYAHEALALAKVLGLKNRIKMFEGWISNLQDIKVSLELGNPAVKDWVDHAEAGRILALGRYADLSREERKYPEHDIALAFMHYDLESPFGKAYQKLLTGRYDQVFDYDLAPYKEYGVFIQLFAELRLGKIKSATDFLAMLVPSADSVALRSMLFFVYDIVKGKDCYASLLDFQIHVEKMNFREDLLNVARDLAPAELVFGKFCFDSPFYQQLFFSIPVAYRDGVLYKGETLEERSVVPAYLSGQTEKPHRNTISRFRNRLEAQGILLERMVSVRSIVLFAERNQNMQLKEYLSKTFRYNPA